ncbi:hypothetical protein [Streptomyces sp. CBMA123]|uniref:hypothetical protein n=1 Tax=Streptomyces sp. CBMA123 TaxID=1896313 RepID=UPI001661A753|nr:hypothetical protein [Streptomyces sp. CBMA123]
MTWLEWRRPARSRGSALLVTGPFTGHDGFAGAARARTLRFLVVPLAGLGR